MHIDGSSVPGTSGRSFVHVNPATGQSQVEFQLAGPAEVEAAVQTSKAAQQKWRRESPARRRDLLQALAQAVRDHTDRASGADEHTIG